MFFYLQLCGGVGDALTVDFFAATPHTGQFELKR